jgi:hypothetical protein
LCMGMDLRCSAWARWGRLRSGEGMSASIFARCMGKRGGRVEKDVRGVRRGVEVNKVS